MTGLQDRAEALAKARKTWTEARLRVARKIMILIEWVRSLIRSGNDRRARKS